MQYMVKAFVPNIAGCGGTDKGWDDTRCNQFEEFLNKYASNGWILHSSDYREVTVQGCGGGKGAWLVCTFQKNS